MKLTVEHASTDMLYRVLFQEPILEHWSEQNRLKLSQAMIKSFGIRVNDLKWFNEQVGDRWVSFSRFYDQTFLNVSVGAEEASAVLRNVSNEMLAKDIFGRLHENISAFGISQQKLTAQQHFRAGENVNAYLKTINPYRPEKLDQFSEERGIILKFRVTEHNLLLYVVAVNSVIVPNGLYLNVDFEFAPSKYGFVDAVKIAEQYYDMLLEDLHLSIKGERK